MHRCFSIRLMPPKALEEAWSSVSELTNPTDGLTKNRWSDGWAGNENNSGAQRLIFIPFWALRRRVNL